MKALFLAVSAIFLTLLLLGCDGAIPDGQIRVKNDSQDSQYNIVRVSGGGVGGSLKPGDTLLLPHGTTSISFSRAYKNYTRSYRVQCPRMKKNDSGFQIKLIDVHLNRMKGGCKTVYANKG